MARYGFGTPPTEHSNAAFSIRPVEVCCQSRPGQTVAALPPARSDQSLRLWSAAGVLLSQLEAVGNDITSLHFIRDRDELVFTTGGSGEADESVVLDLGSMRTAAFHRHENTVLDCAVSSDGNIVASADANGEIHVWKTHDGTLLRPLPPIFRAF